jgi:hypothetical protein
MRGKKREVIQSGEEEEEKNRKETAQCDGGKEWLRERSSSREGFVIRNEPGKVK